MQHHLYFVCPTDHLETVIKNTFGNKNYFLTSLGNSISFEKEITVYLQELLQSKYISDISFVLANDNRIVLDALQNKDYIRVTGLSDFYDHIISQNEHYDEAWQIRDTNFMLLSYILNVKIQELKKSLCISHNDSINIHGKIYDRPSKVFDEIYSNLICRDFVGIN